jgi:hypothetical protein
MADKRSFVSAVQLKGPLGSVTTDKRTLITWVNLHGSKDVRTIISAVSLEAPPPDKKTYVSSIALVGPQSTPHVAYYGTTAGWMPVDLYLPGANVWTKIG